MNILQITPYFYPAWSYGGIPRVVYELSRALVRKGNKVITLTTDVLSKEKRYEKREDTIEGIETHYFPNINNELAYHYQMYLPIGMRRWLSTELQGIDIAHMNGHRHFLNNIALKALKEKKIPFVFSAHGTLLRIERRIFMKKMFDLFWGNEIIKNADHFIAVSEKEADQYLSLGIPKEKISVIYNGIDVNLYNNLPGKGIFRQKYSLFNKTIVLFLGKLTPNKGLDVLVKTIADIPDNNIVLVVAGNDMGFKSTVERSIEQLNIKERVIFTGLLAGEKKLSAYVDADVLVYPSTDEIFGLVPFEAIMCGTPVIVTNDCGCVEIIGRVGAGDIVEYGDVEGLKDKILDVLNNREEARQKVEKGKEFIQQHLRWETISDEIKKVYEKL
jgi:glycosyltransferase involved in cell wall biosynthesis